MTCTSFISCSVKSYQKQEYILVDAKDKITKDYVVVGKDCNVAVKYHITMDDIRCVHYDRYIEFLMVIDHCSFSYLGIFGQRANSYLPKQPIFG